MKLLNNLVVIAWHTPQKYVMVLIGTTSIRLSKDNHDSWDGFSLSFWLGHVEVGLLGCGSVMVRLHGTIEIVIFEEMSLLPYY
jgi:hypothetical protein